MISCIIPTRDRRHLIGAAIRSVLAQGAVPASMEILVVDDGSNDQTRTYVRATFPQVKLIEAGGVGPGAARNIGASEATGEILMFLDSDDIWHKYHAATLMMTMEAAGTQCAFGITRNIDLKGGGRFFIPGGPVMMQNMSEDMGELLGHWCFFVPSSFAVTKAAFERIGGFPNGMGLGEDWIFFLRLSVEYSMAFAPDVITTRRLQSSSLCRTHVSTQSLLNLMDVLEEELRSQGRWNEEFAQLYGKRRELIRKEGRAWNSVQDWYMAMLRQGLVPEGL